jgi:hypothetical protein
VALYRIVVAGRLEPSHRAELDQFSVEASDQDTVLTGPVVDQAQLQGVLDRIAALELVLVSVNRIDEPSGGGPEPPRAG